MGRVKLKITRLESTSNRQVTYSKRRNGILKKARELSILCDIDIVLLTFSPTGRPTLFHGQQSSIEEVIARVAQLTPQERAKRKLESLEGLKKTFKKLDHDVNIQYFLGASTQTVEELTDQVRLLQAQLTEVHKRLSFWSNPSNADSMEHLRQMEDSLRESITCIQLHKENFGKHQLVPLDFTSQNGMHLPLTMSGVRETQPLSWLPHTDSRHLLLQNGPNFLPQRFHFPLLFCGTHGFCVFGDMGCSEDGPIPNYSSFMGNGKVIEVDNSVQADNMGNGCGALNELNTSACLNLQLGEQYSYSLYSSLTIPDDKKLKPEMQMNLLGNSAVYHVNSNFEFPRPLYGDEHHDWVSKSGPCDISMFDDNSYQQQQNQLP